MAEQESPMGRIARLRDEAYRHSTQSNDPLLPALTKGFDLLSVAGDTNCDPIRFHRALASLKSEGALSLSYEKNPDPARLMTYRLLEAMYAGFSKNFIPNNGPAAVEATVAAVSSNSSVVGNSGNIAVKKEAVDSTEVSIIKDVRSEERDVIVLSNSVAPAKRKAADSIEKNGGTNEENEGGRVVKRPKTKLDREIVQIDDSEEESGEENEAPPAKVFHAKNPAAAPKRNVNEGISDQEPRREEEHKKTLFVKGFDKSFDDDEIKELHPLIVGVRRANFKSPYAWVTFASEANANKAYPDLSKMEGLTVKYCGIDPKLLYVRGITGICTVAKLKTELKNIFKTASDVRIPRESKKKLGKTDVHALIHFESEEEAKSVFDNNKNLKINGSQLTVIYGFRIKEAEKKAAALKKVEIEKKNVPAPAKKLVAQDESDSDESSSSDESIDDSPKKKAPPTRLPPAKKGKIPESESDEDDDDDSSEE